MTRRRAEPQPDCQTCGLCCVAPYDQDVFADLIEADLVQLPKRAHKHVRTPSTFDQLAAVIDGRALEYAALATKEIGVGSTMPLKDPEARRRYHNDCLMERYRSWYYSDCVAG